MIEGSIECNFQKVGEFIYACLCIDLKILYSEKKVGSCHPGSQETFLQLQNEEMFVTAYL